MDALRVDAAAPRLEQEKLPFFVLQKRIAAGS